MLTLIDFYADWCAPCQAVKPILKTVMKDFDGKIELKKIDVDKNPADAQKYGILNIPTLVLLKNDKEIDRKVGLVTEDSLKSWVEGYL